MLQHEGVSRANADNTRSGKSNTRMMTIGGVHAASRAPIAKYSLAYKKQAASLYNQATETSDTEVFFPPLPIVRLAHHACRCGRDNARSSGTHQHRVRHLLQTVEFPTGHATRWKGSETVIPTALLPVGASQDAHVAPSFQFPVYHRSDGPVRPCRTRSQTANGRSREPFRRLQFDHSEAPHVNSVSK
jgi:hypothetical protein